MAKPPRRPARKKSTDNTGPKRRTGGKTAQKPQSEGRKFRLLRGSLTLLLILGIFAFVGSLYMRDAVIARVRGRAVASSSMVFARPFAVTRGKTLNQIKLLSRLERLDYRRVSRQPKMPGEYRVADAVVWIFVRSARLPEEKNQEAVLVKVSLAANGVIEDIRDAKFNRRLDHIWLEPEVLSLLAEGERRAVTPKELDEFSPYLRDAILSIEDERFYSHFGIDPVAVARAFAANLQSGRIVQGGSTITQQLAKNLFLESERTYVRKFVEAFSALLIETAFRKDEILELYMNEVFLGQEGRVAVHGFGEAARTFFSKDAADLSIAEAAMLAGIIKAPSSYSPRRHPKRARRRRDVVLQKMHELGKISAKDFQKALAEELHVRSAGRSRRRAPYFVDFVRRELEQNFDWQQLSTNKARIYSSLDLEYQECAEKAVSDGLAKLEKSYPRLKKQSSPAQAALVAMTPGTAEVVAWVGGRNFGLNQFDRVSMAKRQPGSAFKPFVYLTALDRDLNNYRAARPTSILSDEPITLNIPGSSAWSPQNYDKEFRGDVTVRLALAKSLNIPTVNLALKVGIDKVAQTAELFGFGRNLPRVPSLALGAGEVTPIELARAYAAVANGGVWLEPRPILAVLEGEAGSTIYRSRLQEQRVASEPATFVLINLLQSVVEDGTGRVVRRLGVEGPVAGKTGTTNDARDSWFAGFTPRLLAVVWVGFDDSRPLGLTGSQAAAPIWAEFIKCAAPMEPRLKFLAPPGVVYREIDLRTGMLDNGQCPRDQVVTELFVEGTEPLQHSPCGDFLPRPEPEDDFPRWRRESTPLRPDQRDLEIQPRRGFFERLFGG